MKDLSKLALFQVFRTRPRSARPIVLEDFFSPRPRPVTLRAAAAQLGVPAEAIYRALLHGAAVLDPTALSAWKKAAGRVARDGARKRDQVSGASAST